VSTLDAIILRLVDHAETHRIVTLLTPEQGQLGCLARGARGRSRRFGGHLDLFHRADVILTPSRSKRGLATLKELTVTEAHEPIRSDVTRFATASFLAELALATTTDGAPAEVQFSLLAETLADLSAGADDERMDLVLSFQLRWFNALGELPALTAEALHHAHLPVPEERSLAAARALAQGVRITDLDPSTAKAIGGLTKALRNRVVGRPMNSLKLLGQLLT
jgi:DNA repair protein RecO